VRNAAAMAPLEKRPQAGTNRDPAGLRPSRSPRLIRARSFANQAKRPAFRASPVSAAAPRADPSRGKTASGTAAAGATRDVAANFAKFIGYPDDG
jgi:hypothetical protein